MKKYVILFLIILSACTSTSDDKSILDKSICKLPCWNNIIAGQTKESELLQILENLTDIDQKSIQNTKQPWSIFDNQINFSFRQNWTISSKRNIRSEVYLTKDLVSELILCGKLNTTIGDIVKEIGEPKNILSGDDITGSRLVVLTSPHKGISFSYTTDKSLGDQQYELTSDIQVDCLDLFDPPLYEKLLDAKLLPGTYYNAEETLKVMYPWNGYGNLDEKYPPRQP